MSFSDCFAGGWQHETSQFLSTILDAFRFVNYYNVGYFWQAYTYLLPQQFGCVYSATRALPWPPNKVFVSFFLFYKLSANQGVRI